jgi:hypothetical protein
VIYYNETFATEEDAKAYKDSITRAYHPAGYGTSLEIIPEPDGTFRVKGMRYASCD